MLNRILLTTDSVGGVWQYSLELARGLARQNVHTILVVLGPPPESAQRQEATAIPGLQLMVSDLPLDWLAETLNQLEFAAQSLAAMARQINADTVQLHAPALVGHARWPVPVVAVAHSCVATWWQAVRKSPLPPDLTWRAEATWTGLTRADRIIAPSASFADSLRDCYGTTRPIDIVLNARTPTPANAQRQQHALTVGRLWDEGKNFATLDLAAGISAVPVLAAGPATGPNGTQFYPRNIRMLGSLDTTSLAPEYARASVFVSISHYEPFGLAVLEAAQAGCALVLSDIPTFRELWSGAALFVPGDQPDQIAAAIETSLREAEIQGTRASQHATRFSVPQTTAAILRIHQQLTSEARTAA